MGRGELHSLSKKPSSKFIRFGCQGATNLSFQFDIKETVKKINLVASGPSPNLDLWHHTTSSPFYYHAPVPLMYRIGKIRKILAMTMLPLHAHGTRKAVQAYSRPLLWKSIKGTVARDFRLLFFSWIDPIWASVSYPKIFLNFVLNSWTYSISKVVPQGLIPRRKLCPFKGTGKLSKLFCLILQDLNLPVGPDTPQNKIRPSRTMARLCAFQSRCLFCEVWYPAAQSPAGSDSPPKKVLRGIRPIETKSCGVSSPKEQILNMNISANSKQNSKKMFMVWISASILEEKKTGWRSGATVRYWVPFDPNSCWCVFICRYSSTDPHPALRSIDIFEPIFSPYNYFC